MITIKRKYILGGAISLALLCILPIVAFGQGSSSYAQSLRHLRYVMAPNWRSRALSIGRLIFITLLVIDVIFLGFSIALGNIQRPTLQILINKIIIYAILYAILYFFSYLGYIVWGFQNIAAQITGFDQHVSSYNLLKEGWRFLQQVSQNSLEKFSFWSLLTNKGTTLFNVFMMMLMGFVVLFGFFAVALEYAFLQIEIILAITIGPIFLGFAPLKSTRGWATGYITFLIGLGIRLFVFFIVLGFAYGTINSILSTIKNAKEINFAIEYSVAFFAILTVFLLAKLPAKIEDKITSKANFDIDRLLPTQLGE